MRFEQDWRQMLALTSVTPVGPPPAKLFLQGGTGAFQNVPFRKRPDGRRSRRTEFARQTAQDTGDVILKRI